MRAVLGLSVVTVALCFSACKETDLQGCIEAIASGPLPVASTRDQRFEGKVRESTARCRGGDVALRFLALPWVDWSNYHGARDAASLSTPSENRRGVGGALIDLEYQRIELIKFNLFDNSGTFEGYVKGRPGTEGPALKTWPEMRLPAGHPNYADVGGAGDQVCAGALIRGRTLTGICNDIRNPLMGSSGTLFARNVEFEETFPDAGFNEITRNRHGDRLLLMTPDPAVISRKLFTRPQSTPASCADGYGMPGFSTDANCDYTKAPFFNVLAAFWIQFMTHDWFSHLEEGHNAAEYMTVGCASQKANGVETPLTPEDVKHLGCRPGDQMDRAYIAQEGRPPTFTHGGQEYLARAFKTTRNTVTAWWDASQIYGYDSTSLRRVKRDPADPAKLLMVRRGSRSGEGEKYGYLPIFRAGDPINPAWADQEATAFPDNWTIGLSFLHNLFVREHNIFVDTFRERAARTPDDDSGLRNPTDPTRVI